jgi:EAL domain-containing protein (putative c-di-GMP-specific phosphodiesterase class I)
MVELATGRASGAEALVRWRHPTRGLLLPDTFIALAEETGDITRVTQFVLAESCRLAKSWSRPGLGAVPTVSVNVSIQDFDSAGFAQLVERALSSTGLPPDRLVLEITETLMLDDPTGVLIVLRQLSNLGVRIALDDFGTGYSSLSQIVRLPLDSIKIAKPLVDALGIDPRADSLVRGLVELGHALDLQLVAEGIESSSQLALLQEFGCDVGQGYLFSKPVSASQFDTWMQTNGGTVPLVGTVPSASAPTGPPRLPVVGGAGELSPLEHVSVSR